MNSFVDTNVSIAYLFLIDPFNKKSENVFKEYDNIFWSNNVKKEFETVFKNKLHILSLFYNNLKRDLKQMGHVIFSFENLIKYVDKDKRYTLKEKYNIKSTLSSFWDFYVNNQFSEIIEVINAVNNCLTDLSFLIYERKSEWYEKIKLTPLRTKIYEFLHKKLIDLNVHFPDDCIILDAHDFNLKIDDNLDFITFDTKFYNSINMIEEFSFNKIKCKEDYF